MKLPINQILCGDCIEVTKSFPNESIDCIVTDPPYGIGFMGKEWDKALPPKEAFQEMFRVLKPGALAFVMSSPRQDVLWRMMRMLEGCGFQLRQSFVSWIYKSGFPKAYDISLGIDIKFIREEFRKEHGRKPTKEEIKKLVKEKRKIVGSGKGTSWKYQNKINAEQGFRPSPYYEEKNGDFPITAPSSDLAKKWQGWKSVTGLKPALECVLMVNKPLRERTIVNNVLRHGVGAINVDACRIPFESDEDKEKIKRVEYLEDIRSGQYGSGTKKRRLDLGKVTIHPQKGRFPANLLVSDKALDTGKITKGVRSKRGGNITTGSERFGWQKGEKEKFDKESAYECGYGDVGDQSRYFDLDAWARHHGFLDVPKASKSERNKGLEMLETKPSPFKVGYKINVGRKAPKGSYPRKNDHPTVKPIKLMAYLIELGCPRQGIVLDPFVGSGTTCIAAKRLRRKWIGIEINKEYVQIAEARLQSPKGLESFFV